MKEKREQWKKKVLTTLVVLFFASLPFERIPTMELAGFTVKISYVLGILLVGFSLETLWKTKITKTDITLGLLWFIGLVSSFFAQDHKRAIITICLWLFVFVIYRILENQISAALRSRIESVLIWVSLAIALFGLYQFIGDSLGLSPVWTGLRERYTKPVLGFPRVQSVALEPLYYANFLLVPIFITIKKHLFAASSFNKYSLALVVLLSSFILTVSRGAYLAFVVGVILFLSYYFIAYRPGRKKGTLGLFLILALSLVLSLGLVASLNGLQNLYRFSDHVAVQDSTNQASVEGRTQGYQIAWDKFVAHPLLGVGPGNSGLLTDPVVDHGEIFYYGSLNNIYLEILSETGFLGALFFLLFLVLMVVESYSLFISLDREGRLSMCAVASGLVAIFVQYNFFSTLYIIYIWAFLALLKSFTMNLSGHQAGQEPTGQVQGK